MLKLAAALLKTPKNFAHATKRQANVIASQATPEITAKSFVNLASGGMSALRGALVLTEALVTP